MRRVRGVLFVDYVRMLRRRKAENLDRLLTPEDLPYLSMRIEQDAWYPMETFERLGLAILGQVVGEQSDAIRLWGRTQILDILKFVPGLVVPGAPRDTVMAFGNFLRSLFDFPALSIDSVTDEDATIHISYGMSPPAEEAASWQALGFFESLVEESGGEAARGQFGARAWEGAPQTELLLGWQQGGSPVPARVVRVLVVDDEPLVLAALQRSLRRWADVTCVSSPREALEVLSALPIDAVLCDYDLGTERNGLDLLAEVARRWPGAGRILHTAHAPTRAREALATGVLHSVAEKPVTPTELRRSIERAQRAALSRR